MKKKEKNNDKSTYTSIVTASAGTLIGGGIGALLGPELALILGASGNAIGGTLGYALARNPDWTSIFIEKITAEKLIASKLIKDYNFSVIDELSSVSKIHESSLKRIDLLSDVKKRNFAKLTSKTSFKWLGNNLNHIKRSLKNDDIPHELKQYADQINEFTIKNGKIKFSCECIEPGCVSVIKSLKDQSRFGLNIELDYNDTSGVYQIDSIAKEKSKFDFVITANAPFFLYGDKNSEIKKYRHCFEIHGEEQVILRRKSIKKTKNKRIHVFSDSSAEEQFLIENNVYENTELFSHKYYEQLSDVISNLDAGELIIAWEPLATFLSHNIWIKKNEDVFFNYISLFQHQRWGNKQLKKLGEKIKMLFIFEWLYSKENRIRAIELIVSDKEFIKRFELGSGINVPVAFKK